MPDIRECSNALSMQMRVLKERLRSEGQDILNTIGNVYVNGNLAVSMEGRTPQKMLRALHIVATAYQADMIGLGNELWCPGPLFMTRNPDTDKMWNPGELQKYYETHGDTEVILSALVTLVASRTSDDVVHSIQPYKDVKGEIEWLVDPDLYQSEGTFLGRTPSELWAIMHSPPLSAAMEQVHPGTGAQWDSAILENPELAYFARMTGVKRVMDERLVEGVLLDKADSDPDRLDATLKRLDDLYHPEVDGP